MPHIETRVEAREALSPCRVPPIIHQTFKTADVPPAMYSAVKTWIDRNPGFAYRFSDNHDCRNFIAQHFDSDVLRAYDKLKQGAYKADLWRYCKIYIEGGVYADIDTVCRAGLTGLIRPDDDFLTPIAGGVNERLYNGFFCGRPRLPFLRLAIERATATINDGEGADTDDYPGLHVVGPGCLGRAYNIWLGRAETTKQTLGFAEVEVSGERFRIRIVENRRATLKTPSSIVDNEKIFLWTKYNGYEADLAAAGLSHWTDHRAYAKSPIVRIKKTVGRVLDMLR